MNPYEKEIKDKLGGKQVEAVQIANGITYSDGSKLFNEGDTIFLQVKDEPQARRIGWIVRKQKRFYTERIPSRHLHQKSQCYGFCFQLLKNAQAFDEVVIVEPTRMLSAKVKDILDENNFPYFKAQGFERQIFYPLDKFKITC